MKVRLILGGMLGWLLVCAPAALAQDMANASSSRATFPLFFKSSFLTCLQGSGKKPQTPSATVSVVKGSLNDTLTIKLRHVKPHLAFDLFTVENSPFFANGTANPAFTGSFGLAWYQSDIQTNSAGNATVTIKTILVNQIFGFDPDASLSPTNTFHVGFWFNDPNDAAACGFDPTKPTPFNGEHKAGPVAMISGADLTTGLGPLCLDPNTSTIPATCNP